MLRYFIFFFLTFGVSFSQPVEVASAANGWMTSLTRKATSIDKMKLKETTDSKYNRYNKVEDMYDDATARARVYEKDMAKRDKEQIKARDTYRKKANEWSNKWVKTDVNGQWSGKNFGSETRDNFGERVGKLTTKKVDVLKQKGGPMNTPSAEKSKLFSKPHIAEGWKTLGGALEKKEQANNTNVNANTNATVSASANSSANANNTTTTNGTTTNNNANNSLNNTTNTGLNGSTSPNVSSSNVTTPTVASLNVSSNVKSPSLNGVNVTGGLSPSGSTQVMSNSPTSGIKNGGTSGSTQNGLFVSGSAMSSLPSGTSPSVNPSLPGVGGVNTFLSKQNGQPQGDQALTIAMDRSGKLAGIEEAKKAELLGYANQKRISDAQKGIIEGKMSKLYSDYQKKFFPYQKVRPLASGFVNNAPKIRFHRTVKQHYINKARAKSLLERMKMARKKMSLNADNSDYYKTEIDWKSDEKLNAFLSNDDWKNSIEERYRKEKEEIQKSKEKEFQNGEVEIDTLRRDERMHLDSIKESVRKAEQELQKRAEKLRNALAEERKVNEKRTLEVLRQKDEEFQRKKEEMKREFKKVMESAFDEMQRKALRKWGAGGNSDSEDLKRLKEASGRVLKQLKEKKYVSLVNQS
ncbi:hypothetical protein EIN_025630 [Entamoeba invadens IP1]|uniref:hypothetical protein n=1 Tax=Entamoeba invadens IP1 TaxID=370355 RepID=UPI0002C3E20E|nr:hypothetical protein EIN_025630 [Entamoeba invadens IP1]ELP90734.1 hypothetical protein EIN_025630 [Entamoeba invadens IP1]|eukprot:XP_004257505.1 hypothetical protein EIN_025630 [Entamoeba invadens IP1]